MTDTTKDRTETILDADGSILGDGARFRQTKRPRIAPGPPLSPITCHLQPITYHLPPITHPLSHGGAVTGGRAQYIPPIPPPGGMGMSFFSSFFSTITASVVSSRPEMDAAFWSALRVTFVGSMTPAATRSS